MKKEARAIFWYAAALLYAIAVVFLSSIPQLTTPNMGFEMGDKVLHFIEYFIFALLWYPALSRAIGKRKLPLLWLLVIYGAVFAALDEVHQYFVPNREMDVWDFLADFAGLLLAISILFIWQRVRGNSLNRMAIE